MATLKNDTRATLIHGQTGQEVEDTTLAAGAEYTLEGPGRTRPDGTDTMTILVEGFRYRVNASDVA